MGGAVRRNAGWEGVLDRTTEHLVVNVIPDELLQIGGLGVKHVGAAFDAYCRYWFWLGTGATRTAGSTEDLSDNPALEDLLRVVEGAV